ncbi:helix-turn-helix domain-containing protein [Patescibacteria group bacterium]|nr:helix-turn-helix domain-containing protein [Patescibacteria group bacterium]
MKDNTHIQVDRYFDLRGLASYSSLGVGTLRDYLKQGLIPAFKIKGKVLIRKSEFDQWIEAFRLETKEDLDAMATDIVEVLNKG